MKTNVSAINESGVANQSNTLPLPNIATKVLLSLSAAVLLVFCCHSAFAQESGLKLPEDLAAKAEENNADKYQVQESRVGGRLERVTVQHNNGVTEIYENREFDSMWISEEKELGELQNVRRWTIGSW